MSEFTFHPLSMHMRQDGFVPGLDRQLDLSPLVTQATSHLDEGSLAHVVKSAMREAENEVQFRQSVMQHLLDRKYAPELRRAAFDDAVHFYRAHRKSSTSMIPTFTVAPSRLPNQSGQLQKAARGGKYHVRVPSGDGKFTYVYSAEKYAQRADAHVRGDEAQKARLTESVQRMLDKAGEKGCDPSKFASLVERYGAKAVTDALKAAGAKACDGRIAKSVDATTTSATATTIVAIARPQMLVPVEKFAFGDRQLPRGDRQLAKGEPEALPSAPPVGGASSGGGMSPKKLPVGARRIWNKRIVERMPDNKWHVVGHVAGLEDPHRVPQLGPNDIDPKHLKELIAKLKEIIAHEKKHAVHARTHEAVHAPLPAAGK